MVRRMVSYGHSWVDGDGASSAETSLASITARLLGMELDNRGVGGSSSTGTAALVTADPPPPADLYLLMTGLNDLRLGGDAPPAIHAYCGALTAIFDSFTRAAPTAAVVAVAQPHLLDFSLHAPHNKGSNALVDAYNHELCRIAGSYPNVRVAAAADWKAGSMLADDTVHPNDAGHWCLAQAAAAAVTAAWR